MSQTTSVDQSSSFPGFSIQGAHFWKTVNEEIKQGAPILAQSPLSKISAFEFAAPSGRAHISTPIEVGHNRHAGTEIDDHRRALSAS